MEDLSRLLPRQAPTAVIDPLLEPHQWWYLRDLPELEDQRRDPAFRVREQSRNLDGDICFALYTAAYIWGGPRPVRTYTIKLSREVDDTVPVRSLGLRAGDITQIGHCWVTTPVRTMIDLLAHDLPDSAQRIVDMRAHLPVRQAIAALEHRPIEWQTRAEMIALLQALG
ncbi:MAG: hypothetical protein Q4Q03_08075 [Bowdeniella nasicola]|nr:hypothetical protein [Bowdeniella nasicola]